MLSVASVIDTYYPGLTERKPLIGKSLQLFLRYLWHEQEFQQFGNTYPHLEGFDFVEQVLSYFEFDYKIKPFEVERIPTHGSLIITANHPIGTLDGLALLHMLSKVRPDVKAIVNDFLYAIEPLRPVLLPVDNMGGNTKKKNIQNIYQHLSNEGAVIIFPAGEVSRIAPTGIKDGKWNASFLRFAQKSGAPIVPVCIDGRNSVFFYSLSLLAKPLSTLWLIREMFKQAKRNIDIHVGNPVVPREYQILNLEADKIAKLFKQHTYRLSKKNNRYLKFKDSFEAIAHPENRQLIQKEIQSCEILGTTSDGKVIYLYQYQTNSVLLRELGRLREISFRAVDEGSGKKRDIDGYDHYYDHIILWDKDDLEIVGAYRMVRTQSILNQTSNALLYTQTLFDFKPDIEAYLENGLELGRSFVQPKYWGKRAIDYLWFGIGAYLRKYPEIRYLFGPVSISGSYPHQAKLALVNFYKTHFAAPSNLVTAKNPFAIGTEDCGLSTLSGDVKADFQQLKAQLKTMGVTVPTLYKQYSELCEPGGVMFCDFHVDPDFSNSLDGFMILDRQKMKKEKAQRYIG